jgi:hypothetical protein
MGIHPLKPENEMGEESIFSENKPIPEPQETQKKVNTPLNVVKLGNPRTNLGF